MDDEFLEEFGLLDADELTCVECGDPVDVSDTEDYEKMVSRILTHGETEHGWETDN